MNIFDIIGYTNSRSYPLESKTSVGYFALIPSETPPSGISKIYYGGDNITSIYYGSLAVQSIYYGSVLVWENSV